MSENKEPWSQNEFGSVVMCNGEYASAHNGKRIVDCVNACAGMDDPAKEIAAMRKVVDAARSRCECPIGRTNCDRDETMCDVVDLCIALAELEAKE